ncbi:MAG: chloride channel protein, partial [Pseudomonadota bacterium]
VRPNWRNFMESGALKIWILSLFIGAIVGIAAIVFREAIGLVQYWWLRNTTENTLTAAQNVAWYWILAAPVVGGVIVGQLLHKLSAKRAGNVQCHHLAGR